MTTTEIELHQVSLKVFLRNGLGQTLILKPPDHWTIAGFYDVPGGRIDVGEHDLPFLEIIKRELVEEIGVTDAIIQPHPVGLGRRMIPASVIKLNRDTPILYVFFEAETASTEIQLVEKAYVGVEWVEIETIDINKYFAPGFREGVGMYQQWLQENGRHRRHAP